MATAAKPIEAFAPDSVLIRPGQRLFTASDLAAMPSCLPSGPVSFELHHGRLVPCSPSGARRGNLRCRLGTELYLRAEQKEHGKAYAKVGIVLARRPDHVTCADSAYVAKRSFPVRVSSDGYLETMPELVVEICDRNCRAAEMNDRAADYLRYGVQLVWIVDPEPESVIEHRPESKPKTYKKSESLTCEDIIPGFQLVLAELFQP